MDLWRKIIRHFNKKEERINIIVNLLTTLYIHIDNTSKQAEFFMWLAHFYLDFDNWAWVRNQTRFVMEKICKNVILAQKLLHDQDIKVKCCAAIALRDDINLGQAANEVLGEISKQTPPDFCTVIAGAFYRA